jgi:signal recognition particle subunit SRP72
MYLALVQQLLRENNRKDAVVMLKSLGNDSFSLGVVSALVTLYQNAGKTKEACEVLTKAIEHYKKKGNGERTITLLWRQSVQLMMADGNHEAAVKSLEKLRESSPNDPSTLAQLIIAYSKYDVDKAQKLTRLLPPLKKPSDLDIEALESPNWLTSMKLLKKTAKDSAPPTPLEVSKSLPTSPEKKKRKRKKKSKVPANYDAAKNPDPERWLPRYERSGFKPKKIRKGKVDVGKGTQGASTDASAIYDMSAKVGARAASTPDESPGPSTASWKKEGKKKRKKR